MDWAEFILAHESDDLTRLVLSREKYPDVDVALSAATIECRRKLRDKVPQWYAHPELIFPLRLSAEQCSSTATARYKAALAASAPAGTAFVERLHSASPHSGPSQRVKSGFHPLAGGPLPLHSRLPKNYAFLGTSRPGAASFPEGSACRSGSVADLTGGLGVDSWAFSEVFGQVLYNEMVPELAEAARHNFAVLGADNIRVTNFRIVPSADLSGPVGGISPNSRDGDGVVGIDVDVDVDVDVDDAVGDGPTFDAVDGGSKVVGTASDTVATVGAILGGFRPDIIYLDPARRGAGGRKVFLLEDCSPDVTALLPELFAAAPYILLKLSPMADISMLLGRLQHVREVHVVATGGECKELLLLLERGFEGEAEIVAVEIPEQGRNEFRFRRSEEAAASPAYGTPVVGELLFEPGKALSKAGCFNLITERFGLRKLGPNTHLYLPTCKVPLEGTGPVTKSPVFVTSPQGSVGTGNTCHISVPVLPGKWFRVEEVLPLDKRGIAEAGAKYPGADVSARGVPLSSDELALRLRKASRKIPEQVRNDSNGVRNDSSGVRNDGLCHIFGVHCAVKASNLLLVCIPV